MVRANNERNWTDGRTFESKLMQGEVRKEGTRDDSYFTVELRGYIRRSGGSELQVDDSSVRFSESPPPGITARKSKSVHRRRVEGHGTKTEPKDSKE